MHIKIRYILLIAVATTIIGYFLGNWISWDFIHPTINNKDITINDYYTRLISIIGAGATIFATLIALFKEDIRKCYEFASLKVTFKDANILTELFDHDSTGDSSQENLKATKYEIGIAVQNKGRLAARGCQIYLEELSYKANANPTHKELTTSGKPLPWFGKADLTTIIPTTARVFTTVVEILSPQLETVASDTSAKMKTKAQIKIAGMDLGLPSINGTFHCTFNIYSENASPISYKLEITWNGKWEKRLSEMTQNITIKNVA